MNTAFNCLQKNIDEGRGDQAALVWDSSYTNARRRVTYRELDEMVNSFAGVLQDHGITKGDTVIVYMPMVVEALVAMLACAKIGAIHSVVFGGFAGKELAKRIDDCKAKIILTASCGMEPNRVIPYLPLVEDALKIATHKVGKTIVLQRPQVPALLDEKKGQFEWQREAKRSKALNRKIPYASLNSDDPLYILYTSGTTGVPKGVVREHGGHAVALKWIMKNFMGINAGDTVFAASDLGWVVGHTFICYGPLLAGATSIVYEGKPVTPNPGAFFRIIEEHKVKVLFTAPTALRAILREDPHDHYLRMFDITSLKALFVAGERCDTDTATHYQRLLGVPVIDNYWQTETGYPILGVCLGLENPTADKGEIDAHAVAPVKIGVSGLPLPGFNVQVIDPNSMEQLGADDMGGIVVKTPLPPGVFRSLWKVHLSEAD
jgi:propionyl-CoA synthetase